MISTALLLFFFLSFFYSSFTAAMRDNDTLPKGLKPTHYDLKISDIDVKNLTFRGYVAIDFSVQKQIDAIHLNAKDLKILNVTVNTFDGDVKSSISVSKIYYDTEEQRVIFQLESPVEESTTKVQAIINYTGAIQTDMAGFYKSEYKDQNDKESYILSTQFQATDARRALPCADEPDLKATFDFSITIDEALDIVGNMPIRSSNNTTTKTSAGESVAVKVVTFDTTPIMSTYLLAWAIGEFEYIEGFTERSYNGKNVPIRIYTTKGLSHQGQLALDTAAKCIDYFSEMFDIDYVLPKCDFLAVPEFTAGAMENWGLITCRTTALLYDEATSDSSYKVFVLEVVAHELAHQWFGNLVTMSWWNELWLNEGYATYISWVAVDYLYPEFQVFSRFVAETLQGALGLDSLRTSHPIDVAVKSGADIDQIFDSISYLKGASVIRMISSQLTNEVFIKGVSNYLKTHSYGNAKTVDLWAALTEASGVDVNAAIGPWTLKIGFPLITVTEKENGDVVLRQDRFLSSNDLKEGENDTVWWIPLSISSGVGSNSTTVIKDLPKILDTREITIPGLAKNDFFLLNKNQTSFYRVNYSTERLGKICSSIEKLSLSDKIGLLADVAACAKGGFGSTDGLLTVLSAFRNETDYDLWCEIVGHLKTISSVWFEQPEEVQNGINKFARDLLSYNLDKLGWDFPTDEDYLTSQLRSLIISAAVAYEVPSVITESKALYSKWKNGDKKAVNPSLRSAVFRAALISSTGAELDEVYTTIFGEVLKPTSIDSGEIALGALGKVKDPKYIDRGLAQLLGTDIPKQDLHSIFGSLTGNPLARWKAWNYLKTNWSKIYDTYSSNLVTLSPLVKFAVRSFSSAKAYTEIEAFFSDKKLDGIDRALAQSLDIIKVNSQWIDRDAPVIEAWLKEHKFL